MDWTTHHKNVWQAHDERGAFKVRLIKSKHYSWWLAEFAPAHRDGEVLNYGRHTKAQSAIDVLESIDEDKREVDNG